ncbi:MAG: guanylate kinase [Anaerolineales bacterium]|nr:guanylate kinase [Anaerolineales bacterium]
MFEEIRARQQQPLLIVISGPSGVGKDSVLQRMKERDLSLHFVVTATSRPQRENEVHGVDYFFVTQDEFEKMIENGELIEHALVYEDYKGIPREQVHKALRSGRDVIMRLDVQGAATIRKLYPEALLIFLSTNSEEELIQRLEARRTENPESLALRLRTAHKELGQVELFDYYVINSDHHLQQTVDTIVAIIHAEHHRTTPRRVSV